MGKFRIKGDPFLIRQTCPLLLPGAACNIIDYKNANAKFEYQMFQVYRSLPCHLYYPFEGPLDNKDARVSIASRTRTQLIIARVDTNEPLPWML